MLWKQIVTIAQVIKGHSLGSLRELVGNGTLFNGADMLLGSCAKVLRIEMVHFDSPFLLAMLPPGAFIGLGLMLATKYVIDKKMKVRKAKALLGEPNMEQEHADKA